jgi:alanyl-tRNA synthetase
MTERLYYSDSYVTQFEAHLVAKMHCDKGLGVILDRTFFYPTSGGQEHDIGTLNGVEVMDVVEQDGEILHLLPGDISGTLIDGKIDWERRFDNMQQHTGQHILSRAFIENLGCGTISAHLGTSTSTVDIDTQRLSNEEVNRVEYLANDILTQNREVLVRYVDERDLKTMELRKKPKASGTIRIVEVDGFDLIPCGGTHCRRAGEVGIIKVRKWERVKGNLTRVEFYCGRRALKDYQWKNQMINEIGNSFTIRDTDLKIHFEKNLGELKEKQKKVDLLLGQLLEYEANETIKNSVLEGNVRVVKKTFDNRELNEVRLLAQKLIQFGRVVALFGVRSDKAYLLFARSADMNIDLLTLFHTAIPLIGGKGGGKSDFVQGGGDRLDKVEEAIDFAYRNLHL